ncbi:MAG TPA: polysaccharide biosynthesis/export family protein [Thermoanaerobaculia bacterium]|jgi:polysaccharide export outer membrane protein|nr:polysaccharide biosynthesis/export family protein [Thermoanaerobaculia bacterium]
MKRLMILVLILSALAGIAAAQELPILSTDAPIGPRDIIDVSVLEDKSINNSRATVSEDGTIVLNVLEKVQVSGLTASQIEQRLKSLLEASYLAKATVTVQVVEFSSKPISVVGAVIRPGRISATGNTTLIQAITQAGGLAAGHGKDLYVLRTGSNGLSEQVAVSIEDLMVNGNPDVNIPLAPNDLVNVPADTPITIYMLGEFARPGKALFRSSQTPTLLQAMADAGGQTDRAGKVVVITRNLDGKTERIRVNYRHILSGRVQDVPLRDNDTVFLEAALF